MPAQTAAEYSLDDPIDDASTTLDAVDDGRKSFDQETIVSDIGESVIGAEAIRLDLGNLNLVSWKPGARKVRLGNPTSEGNQGDEARATFHPISDVICHPSKTPAPLRGSRKPLPPTTAGPPPIPKPPPDGFYQPYLDSITKPGPAEEQSGIDSLWSAWDQARRGIKPKPDPSVEALVGSEQLADLSEVNPMFFEADFDIATPHIWQTILGSDDTNGATTAHAQQDLSHQLDVLESHLVSEITQRTPSFFSALSNLQSLTDQTSSCLNRLTSLRNELAGLDRSTAIRGLTIVERQEDLHESRMTERALGELESVVSTLDVVKQVANEGDWVGALEGLEDVGRWWLRMMPKVEETANAKGRTTDARPIKEDVISQDGKHVLSQVREEDEEDVPTSSTIQDSSSVNSAQPFVPLATLSAVQHFPAEMQNVAETIQNQLEISFASICSAMLDNTPPIEVAADAAETQGSDDTSVAKKRSKVTSIRWRISGKDEERLRASFADQIRALLHTLWRTDSDRDQEFGHADGSLGDDQYGTSRGRQSSISRIEEVWRMAVLKSIKEGMRQVLQLGGETDAEAVDGVADSSASGPARSQSLVDTLKDMSHEQFVTISTKIYQTMIARVELVKVLGEVLDKVMQETNPIEPSVLSQVLDVKSASMTPRIQAVDFTESILHSAVDLANARSSKILLTRTEIHAELDLKQFVAVHDGAWQFILWSEALVGRVVGSLRGVVVSQARAFLVKYHAARLQESAKLVEEEQWTQVEVPASSQHIIDLLVKAAMKDPLDFIIGRELDAEQKIDGVDGQGSESPPAGVSSKILRIEEQSFNAVSATLRSVVLLQDYAKVVVSLDVIVSDTMNRIVEYLKSFNSRTCQVVLGAGAMRSAGLKNITAKHLALASQSLSIIISLTPYLREFVRRHLNPKQAVVLIEFDKLKRDYQEHQYEIHAKLISIMADRLTVHCSTLRGIDWEAKSSAMVNGYMEQLLKEITTLHKVLTKYLASSTVHSIMGQVLDATNDKLGEEYKKVEFKTEEAKKRMMQDVAFVVERTKLLTDTSLPSPMEMLDDLVKSKSTPRRTAQMSTALNGLLRRKNEAANSSTASLNESTISAQVNPENVDVDLENDEDALVTSDVPAERQEAVAMQEIARSLPETEDTPATASKEVVIQAPLEEQATTPVLANGSSAAQQESVEQASTEDSEGIEKKTSDEVAATDVAQDAQEPRHTPSTENALP
ncbi:hypothetical protein NliqN6_2039 [Naganishia liquefaciens]|uniref:Vacuolar protein sorting-associated protein 54 C-terminal domain-containing protein n=1 Tax=Naganishia liquefaciens TaxID=104408 RepID=A0A8H3TR09_9TREE|nr:hypothetical protein NliqN6_2039 [Naganishia liquefaciens]